MKVHDNVYLWRASKPPSLGFCWGFFHLSSRRCSCRHRNETTQPKSTQPPTQTQTQTQTQQFHDGLGFLTNHAFLSNTFEASLQQVNPKLTLPYWDFTIESSSSSASVDEEGGVPFANGSRTPVLQPSWFGTSDPKDNMVGRSSSCIAIFFFCGGGREFMVQVFFQEGGGGRRGMRAMSRCFSLLVKRSALFMACSVGLVFTPLVVAGRALKCSAAAVFLFLLLFSRPS